MRITAAKRIRMYRHIKSRFRRPQVKLLKRQEYEIGRKKTLRLRHARFPAVVVKTALRRKSAAFKTVDKQILFGHILVLMPVLPVPIGLFPRHQRNIIEPQQIFRPPEKRQIRRMKRKRHIRPRVARKIAAGKQLMPECAVCLVRRRKSVKIPQKTIARQQKVGTQLQGIRRPHLFQPRCRIGNLAVNVVDFLSRTFGIGKSARIRNRHNLVGTDVRCCSFPASGTRQRHLAPFRSGSCLCRSAPFRSGICAAIRHTARHARRKDHPRPRQKPPHALNRPHRNPLIHGSLHHDRNV